MGKNALIAPSYVKNEKLVSWVQEVAELCKPDQVYWCDGSDEEYERLCNLMVETGMLTRLNPQKRPNSFAAFSNPSVDQALEQGNRAAHGLA